MQVYSGKKGRKEDAELENFESGLV